MFESWLQEVASWIEAWRSLTVIAIGLLVYGLTSLTLRVTEPTNLTERLRLTHGMSPSSEEQDDVVVYRSSRLVLTTFRTASVIAMVIASMRATVQLRQDGDLNIVLVALIGAVIMIVLILIRGALNRVPVSCYADVEMWVKPISGLASLLGRAWPLKRLSSTANEYEANADSQSENTNDLLNVLHNVASKYKTAEDLMQRLPDVVAIDRDRANLNSSVKMVMDGTLDESGVLVIYEDSINKVVGTVSKLDILQQRTRDLSNGTELTWTSVFRLTKSQETAQVVAEFSGRTDKTAVVEDEDGGVVGILTFDRLMLNLLSNGDTDTESGSEEQG